MNEVQKEQFRQIGFRFAPGDEVWIGAKPWDRGLPWRPERGVVLSWGIAMNAPDQCVVRWTSEDGKFTDQVQRLPTELFPTQDQATMWCMEQGMVDKIVIEINEDN